MTAGGGSGGEAAAWARERLMLALDVPSVADALAVVADTRGLVGCYKVGLQLVFSGGLDLVSRLAGEGERVFLDVKLHDIPNTVEGAVAAIARLGANFVTVHGYPATVAAAVAGRGDSNLSILAVTVLTSMDDAELSAAGYRAGVAETVAARARAAVAAGVDGLVCSAREAAGVRPLVGPAVALVTPGIRLEADAAGDQKRITTPAEAIAAGSDYLVVGRPVLAAADRRAACARLLEAIAAAPRPLA